MKKQPTLHPAGAVRISKSLLILTFALFSTAGFAQKDVEISEPDHYKIADMDSEPWLLECDASYSAMALPVKKIEPATVSDNVSIIDQLYQAFAKGDIPGALANMDPKIVWNEAESFPYADRNPYIGPEAVVEGVFARIGQEWEYWNLTGIELHEMANDKVLATLRYQAKYKKNGAEIDAQTAHFWTLKDGKITRFQQFTDTDQVVRAVGQ